MTSVPRLTKDGFHWRFTTPLFIGAALLPINGSLISTALGPIATAMHVPIGHTSVLIAGLYLAGAIAQPTAGKLSEVFGPRRVFRTGILLVLLGGVVGGLAQNLSTLVVARVLIGLGTSTGYPSAMLLIRRRAADDGLLAPPSRVLGGLAITGNATTAVGLPIGGALVGWLGWRSTFLINVPVALIALAAVVAWIPKDEPVEKQRFVEIADRIDAIGIVGFTGALSALLVFLLSVPTPNWAMLGVAVLLGVALVWWELRAATPFLDVRLLGSNLALTRTYLRFGLVMICIYTITYGVSQWLEDRRGFTPERTGLLLLPLTGVAAVAAIIASRRNMIRGPLLVAALSALLGSIALLSLTGSSPLIFIITVTLLFGVSAGTTSIGNQTALYAQAPAALVGTAAGLMRTFAYLGAIGSSAITSIVYHENVTDGGLHIIGLILIAVSVVLLIMTILDRHLHPSRRPTLTEPGTTSAG